MKLLNSQKVWGGVMIDTYNQKIYVDIAPTITTRVNEANAVYVIINYEETKEK